MKLKMKNNLDKINKELQEIEKIMKNDGFFTATKIFLKKATENLKKDNIDSAMNSLSKAKEMAFREIKIYDSLNKNKDKLWDKGISYALYTKISEEVKNGEIDDAENIVIELENAIKRESEILSKLEEVKSLISKKLAGSNIEEATNLYENSMNLLEKGEFEKADELAENAKIAARPSPEFLLQKAREYYLQGVEESEKENFEKAIESWKKSIMEYERAKEFLSNRNDKDMVENIEKNIIKIDECIEGAEIAMDNRVMAKMIEESDAKIKNVENLIEKNKYDEAINLIEHSIGKLNEAINLAKRRNFKDLPKIKKRLDDRKKIKDFYQIEKARYLINEANKIMKKNPKKSEKELYEILRYLESLDINTDLYGQVKSNCKKTIIESKIKQAKNSMKKAENLYKMEKFYDAREIYQEVDDYLLTIEEEVGKLAVPDKIDDIRKLRTICNENVNSCNSQLFNLPDAPERILIEIKDFEEIVLPDNVTPQIKNKNKKSKLEEKLSVEYDLLDYIGGGGFADVYKARWKKKNLIVALKVPRELTPNAEEIFFNEIQKWERLKHRNIVNLIKPRISPVPHIMIEYIDGPTLYDIMMEKGKLSISDACKIAFDIARGLEYAHSKNIIHSDLKPKNILIDSIGEAKITDFGIAKTVSSSSINGIRGLTLIYSAPEQLDDYADEKTDVYQLSLLLYHMIAGINPFDIGSREEIKKKIREEIPDPPSKYNKEIKPLDDTIMQCLAKNPDDRPSIRQVVETIYEYMKRYHGESLHLTEDRKTFIRLAVTHAFYAAKNNDLKECICSLEGSLGKITKTSIKKKVNTLIQQLRIMQEENIEISEKTIEEIEMILRNVA